MHEMLPSHTSRPALTPLLPYNLAIQNRQHFRILTEGGVAAEFKGCILQMQSGTCTSLGPYIRRRITCVGSSTSQPQSVASVWPAHTLQAKGEHLCLNEGWLLQNSAHGIPDLRSGTCTHPGIDTRRTCMCSWTSACAATVPMCCGVLTVRRILEAPVAHSQVCFLPLSCQHILMLTSYHAAG